MFIIFGLAIMALGLLIVMKTEWMLSNFGRIAWFDRHLGLEGGTRLGYRFVGTLIVIFGFMVFTNMHGAFLAWLVSPLTKFNR